MLAQLNAIANHYIMQSAALKRALGGPADVKFTHVQSPVAILVPENVLLPLTESCYLAVTSNPSPAI